MEAMELLPPDTLRGIRVGLSASTSPDLDRLGLLKEHFRLTLGEMARSVLILGGSLQYCGHLEADGITMFLIDELKRYGRSDDPLSVLLAWSVHRRIPNAEIEQVGNELGLLGTIRCLDINGTPIDCTAAAVSELQELSRQEAVTSLTAMRRTAMQETQGRLLIGGRRLDYQGAMPGVLEEALMAIEVGQPIFLAGGFGGVTHDVVAEVDSDATAWLRVDDELAGDAGWRDGLRRLAIAVGGRGWSVLSNGLSDRENARLAATHRPSEISALVSLGLGRLAQRILESRN